MKFCDSKIIYVSHQSSLMKKGSTVGHLIRLNRQCCRRQHSIIEVKNQRDNLVWRDSWSLRVQINRLSLVMNWRAKLYVKSKLVNKLHQLDFFHWAKDCHHFCSGLVLFPVFSVSPDIYEVFTSLHVDRFARIYVRGIVWHQHAMVCWLLVWAR